MSKVFLSLKEVEEKLSNKRGRKSKTTQEILEKLKEIEELNMDIKLSIYNSRKNKSGELKQTTFSIGKWEEVMLKYSHITKEENIILLRQMLYACALIEKKGGDKEKILKTVKVLESLGEGGELHPDFIIRLKMTLRDHWRRLL